jgi:hypothetical protein
MSFSAIVPTGGYGGWLFLKRTEDTQQAALARSPEYKRDDAYFREKIASVTTAEELVSDRRLLTVALGAFGLDDDINNRFFLRKVLEDGTLVSDALSNRLADKRYREFSQAFGFGDVSAPRTTLREFPDEILDRYKVRQFERAVGERSGSLRLALDAERTIAELASRNGSDTTKWFQMMGTPPMRTVVQTALGLPSSLSAIDIDQQLATFKEKARDVLGIERFDDLARPDRMEELLRRYLVLAPGESSLGAASSGSSALQLLQAGQGRSNGAQGLLQILASR